MLILLLHHMCCNIEAKAAAEAKRQAQIQAKQEAAAKREAQIQARKQAAEEKRRAAAEGKYQILYV